MKYKYLKGTDASTAVLQLDAVIKQALRISKHFIGSNRSFCHHIKMKQNEKSVNKLINLANFSSIWAKQKHWNKNRLLKIHQPASDERVLQWRQTPEHTWTQSGSRWRLWGGEWCVSVQLVVTLQEHTRTTEQLVTFSWFIWWPW